MKKIMFFLMATAFCMIAFSCCRTERETTAVKSDERLNRMTFKAKTFKVPESRAELRVSRGELLALPENALYENKKGQATAKIRFLRDTLFVEASCDSLESLVVQYEEEIMRLEESSHEMKQKIRSENTVFLTVLGILAGAVLSTVAFYFYTEFRRRRW